MRVSREPLVSVILPTYDRESLLRESIESVVAQTYEHWRLIVSYNHPLFDHTATQERCH